MKEDKQRRGRKSHKHTKKKREKDKKHRKEHKSRRERPSSSSSSDSDHDLATQTSALTQLERERAAVQAARYILARQPGIRKHFRDVSRGQLMGPRPWRFLCAVCTAGAVFRALATGSGNSHNKAQEQLMLLFGLDCFLVAKKANDCFLTAAT